jgi:hypothetical protein
MKKKLTTKKKPDTRQKTHTSPKHTLKQTPQKNNNSGDNPKLTLEILQKTVNDEYTKLKPLDLEIIQSKLDKMPETALGKQQSNQYDLIKSLVVSIIQTNSVSLTTLKSKKIAEFVPPDGNYKDDVCIMGKYNLKKLERSGRGAFGQVYKFKDGKRTLAVKVVDISAANENSMMKCWGGFNKFFTVEQMEKEAMISRHLGELGIGPKIHDVYYCVNKDKIKYYYVMDYMNRGSLMDYINQNDIKVLPQEYIDKILAKLDKMHKAGYIHDDLHTGNILVNEPRKGKLEFYISDFGLSNKISTKLDAESQELYNDLKYDGNPEKKSLAIQTEYITRMILNTYAVPVVAN